LGCHDIYESFRIPVNIFTVTQLPAGRVWNHMYKSACSGENVMPNGDRVRR
jgi:hypothetical protein